MPLIPLTIDDELYRQLLDDASRKGVSVLDYISTRLAQPKGEVLEKEGEPGEGVAIQPAAALDEEYQCGFTRSHLIDARQKLLGLSVFLGYPLAEKAPPNRGACKDAQWLAQRILTELVWLSESLEADDCRVVDDAPGIAPDANTAEDFNLFWMVMRDMGDGHAVSATKRHPAMFLAFHEAERLCRKERKPFLILQAVARCEAGEPPINWQSAKDAR